MYAMYSLLSFGLLGCRIVYGTTVFGGHRCLGMKATVSRINIPVVRELP